MSANNDQILSVGDLEARPKELDAVAASEITGGTKPPSPHQNPMGPKPPAPPAAAAPAATPAAPIHPGTQKKMDYINSKK